MVPRKCGARTGLQSRRTPEIVAGKADKSENSLSPAARQRAYLARRFEFTPSVAALVASLAFSTQEARL